MEKVNELVQEIRNELIQKGTNENGDVKIKRYASQTDENRVMRAMLNDREYQVGIYDKDGLQGTMCPAQEAREMISSVISSATKISGEEARKLADDHDFSKREAQNMVNISKEFVNTYLPTGRKLPLGGREMSNNALIIKEKQETIKVHDKIVGIDENTGERIIEKNAKTLIPAYNTIKVIQECPEWLKK